jgi:predicted anti-sigma-YlaC factor YlaD
MNCKKIREQLPDVALGLGPAPPDVEAHLASCQECAGTFEALKATMSLLDEWQAPEPSPYWDTRMQARLREEKQKAPASVWSWMRRPGGRSVPGGGRGHLSVEPLDAGA